MENRVGERVGGEGEQNDEKEAERIGGEKSVAEAVS